MSDAVDTRWSQLGPWARWAVAAFCAAAILLLAIRVGSVLMFGDVVHYSGGEGAAIYAIQTLCEDGGDIYARLPDDPNGYVFNFLFYDIYAGIARLTSQCGSDGLVLARLFSLATCLGASAFLWNYARRSGAGLALSAMLAIGPVSPVIGWWCFTIRPDPAAFSASIVAFAFARSSLRSGTWPRMLAAGAVALLFGALAWALKQTFAITFGSVLLYLLICARGWQVRIGLFAVATALVVAAAVLLLGDRELYRHTVIFPANRDFVLSLMASNVGRFLIKASPYLVIGGVVAFGIVRSVLASGARAARAREPIVYLLMMGGLLVVLSYASGLEGASDSYLLPLFAALLAFLVPWSDDRTPARVPDPWMAPAAGLAFVLTMLVLVGAWGTNFHADEESDNRARIVRAMSELPHPQLVIDDLYALPRYTPSADHRLFDYYVYRIGPAQIGNDPDIPGKIRRGVFGTVVIAAEFAGSVDLSAYERRGTYGPVVVFTRR